MILKMFTVFLILFMPGIFVGWYAGKFGFMIATGMIVVIYAIYSPDFSVIGTLLIFQLGLLLWTDRGG